MYEPITREEQDDLRGKLFDSFEKMGKEVGFTRVDLTQTNVSSSHNRMEWTVRVAFSKGARI